MALNLKYLVNLSQIMDKFRNIINWNIQLSGTKQARINLLGPNIAYLSEGQQK